MGGMDAPDETHRAILYLLYEGHDHDEILRMHPNLTRDDIARAAGEGLAALETQGEARVETRAERIARLRIHHPQAFSPWTAEEEDVMTGMLAQGASLGAVAKALGRPRGAIARRMEKMGLRSTRGGGDA